MSRGEECIAKLYYDLGDPERARALVVSLDPDNRTTPEWLRISCGSYNGLIECIVIINGCRDPRRILSLRNTIDDIILNLRAADTATMLATR